MLGFHIDQSIIRQVRRPEGYGMMLIIKLKTSEIYLWYGSVICGEKNQWKVMLQLMIHDLKIVFARTEVLLHPFQQV